jgi:hypothetical protein
MNLVLVADVRGIKYTSSMRNDANGEGDLPDSLDEERQSARESSLQIPSSG